MPQAGERAADAPDEAARAGASAPSDGQPTRAATPGMAHPATPRPDGLDGEMLAPGDDDSGGNSNIDDEDSEERRQNPGRRAADREAEREAESTTEALDIAKGLIQESSEALAEAEEITAEPSASPLGAVPELSRSERREVIRRTAISAVVVHEAIREEGERELRRPPRALAWSGLAAGLSMGFSMVTQGLLEAGLPATAWRPLIASFGYSMGFLIVVLGRQQLFTENTLTAVLPLLTHPNRTTLWKVTRLWLIVLVANLVGAFIFATIVGHAFLFAPDVRQAFTTLGYQALRGSFGIVVLRGVFAGWLIALMVWLLPGAEAGRVHIIVIITYVVSLGGFAHIIAGSVEVLYLVSTGVATWATFLGGFMVPTLIGNIIGGVSLVAALNYAQVVAEVNDSGADEADEADE